LIRFFSFAIAVPYHFIDHVINERSSRHLTRAQQRVATRRAILDATVDALVADGYTALTTRRVAERAGTAQSTVMHHFPTREALVVEAVNQLALDLVEQSLDEIDLPGLRTPDLREAVLDQTWNELTSPRALAAAQLWVAAWDEPELAAKMRELEDRLWPVLVATASTLFPDQADEPEFPALLDLGVSLIRGLVMAIPINGRDAVDARWAAIKPVLLRAAADLLDVET
jgi:AcrR family transcriptional regulator